MKHRWGKWILLSLCLLGFIMLALLVERVRGKRFLEARLATFVRQGEKIRIEELESSVPPPEENAAIALFALTNQLSLLSHHLPISLPSRRLVAPGLAIVSHRLSEWYPDAQRTNRWADVEARLTDARDLLESVRKALERPGFNSGFDYQMGFQPTIPWLSPFAHLMRELNLQTLRELNRTNMEAAYRSLLTTIHFAASLNSELLVMCQLVRQPLAGFACNSTWEALQTGKLTDPQLAGLQAAWERCDFIGDMIRSLEMERAMQIERFAKMRASRSELDRYVAQCDEMNRTGGPGWGAFVTHGTARSYLQLPLWRFAWCYHDTLLEIDSWHHLLEQARLGNNKAWASVENKPAVSDMEWFEDLQHPSQDESLNWFTRFRFPFSSQRSGLSEVLIRKSLMAQTQQQLTLAAIAIQRYQLANHTLPPTLSLLVPRFLPSVPRDRMGGGELHYRPLADGNFSLYSVGANLTDDGGDGAVASGGSAVLLLIEGKDFVWPMAATPKQAAQFLLRARY